MKKPPILTIAVCVAFALTGCVANRSQPSARIAAKRSGYPVNIQSALELATYFKFMPSLSGYYLPPGIYQAEKEDTNGVFFRAPKGFRLIAPTGSTEVEGGIYLPKLGSSEVRAYVYLRPSFGKRDGDYFLPNTFLSAYGRSWSILSQRKTE